jgi:2-phospho-L-lactate guanylyltransferase
MSIWLVVPVKSLRDGKSRLAPSLEPSERSVLVERLLLRTLEQARQFPGLARTLVVSACEETRALAEQFGAHTLEERAPLGLNSALSQARAALLRTEVSRMLIVPCDLPLLSAPDLESLAAAGWADTIAIAPDRLGRGTNGMCLQTALDFAFAFGAQSLPRHLEHARKIGVRHTLVERIGLAFDLDLPEDLTELAMLEQCGIG